MSVRVLSSIYTDMLVRHLRTCPNVLVRKVSELPREMEPALYMYVHKDSAYVTCGQYVAVFLLPEYNPRDIRRCSAYLPVPLDMYAGECQLVDNMIVAGYTHVLLMEA